MGSQIRVTQRVVFDTNTVVSALLFSKGNLAWLRQHWRDAQYTPLLSRSTAAELTRVLAYPKFHLSTEDRNELLADYLPFCEIVTNTKSCPVLCRDIKDQPFLDLAHTGKAISLVSGDQDLLALNGQTTFLIEPPQAFQHRLTTS
jgi:putative PIN family toxin of toxin-antitoxin system